MNPIAIYQSPSGAVDVRLEGKVVWLASVCANFAHTARDRESTAQTLHIPSSEKPLRFDGRDMIISVGHRDRPYAGLQA